MSCKRLVAVGVAGAVVVPACVAAGQESCHQEHLIQAGDAEAEDEFGGGLAIDGDGNVAVADCSNSKIRTFTPAGELLDEWGTYGWAEGQLGFPRDLAIDAAGRLWIVDEGRNSIQVFDRDHNFLTEFGRTGAKPASGFSAVWSIALDDRGQVYVIDALENRVSAFRIEPPLSP